MILFVCLFNTEMCMAQVWWDTGSYFTGSCSPATVSDQKPGDSVAFSCNYSDVDSYGVSCAGPEYNVNDQIVKNFAVASPTNSTIGSSSGQYTAGNSWPTSASSDVVTATWDDVPLPKNPDGEGTRDDTPAGSKSWSFKVRFPAHAYLYQTDSVVYGAGTSWTQKYHFLIKDQFYNILPGVGITENPTTWCSTVTGHDSSYHLYGYDVTGETVTGANGTFTDTYGVGAGNQTSKAQTVYQKYGVSYGTFSLNPLFLYTIKIIHYRDNPSTVIHMTAPQNLTINQQLCTLND